MVGAIPVQSLPFRTGGATLAAAMVAQSSTECGVCRGKGLRRQVAVMARSVEKWSGRRASGYGAQPHGSEARRREGYPTDHSKQSESANATGRAWPMPVKDATPRKGSQCAKDATSRPEKQVFTTPRAPFFYSARKNLQLNQTLTKVYIV